MSTTMKEVAAEANVSVATVSRVLNKKGQVRDATRERVLGAARVLNYTPNGAARSLKTQKTKTLGALLPDLYGEFFTEIIRGVDQSVREAGYHLLTSGSHDDEAEFEAVLKAMRGRVDGLLLMSSRVDVERFAALIPKWLPIVVMSSAATLQTHSFISIDIDNFGGARTIVAHLAAHGHERIATITGPMESRDATERLRGYRAGLREHGISPSEKWEVEGDFMQATGQQLAHQLMEGPAAPTALFAANDSMAMGALSALHERGLRVPEDVAVVGFDDIPSAPYMTPALSTVHVPLAEMGAFAASRLIEELTGHESANSSSRVFPTELRVRASCGCADVHDSTV